MKEMMIVMFGLIMAGIITAGLIVLHYELKKKESAHIVEAMKTTVIPAIQEMTKNVLNESMDMVFEKSIDMTKKMTASLMSDDD